MTASDAAAESARLRTPSAEGDVAFRSRLGESGILEVVLDVPGRSVNTFTSAVMEELDALLDTLASDARIRAALFVSGKEKGFIAGADLAEVAAVEDPDEGRRKVVRGQKVFQKLADLPFPTVAAIHGACLGGGLEFALACRRRIAAFDAELGLPEVNLGILPAWGGTQRVAPLVGSLAAVELVCAGKPVDGKRAFRIGLVDRVVPATELRPRALELARELAEGARERAAAAGLRRLAIEGNPVGRRLLFSRARKKILERTGGHYPAPLRALQAIEEGLEGSIEAGLAVEARLVTGLLVSPVSKNLIHVFQLLESVKHSPHAQAPAGEAAPKRAAVIGAGVMGAGIAQLLAFAGLPVRLRDLDSARVSAGLRAARRTFEKRLRGRDGRALRRHMNRISGTTTYTGFGHVDLVVEAVVEDLPAKREVFAELERHVSSGALLCSNTSALAIAEIAAAVREPSRVAGLHFFNPVDRMPLVEIVRGPRTSERTVGALYRLVLRLGKKPVVVRDSPGFLVNRILMPYLNEALRLFEEGVDAAAIDGAITTYGMPVGPLALLDDIGLDVARHVGGVLAAAFPERMQPAPVIEALVAAGRLGRKTGRGFYAYAGGSRKAADTTLGRTLGLGNGSRPSADPAGARLLTRRDEAGADQAEIERRLLYPMVDEAARCLAEGVAGSPAEVDLAMITGAGFPPFRGGLLRFADALGVAAVVSALERLAATAGARLAPSEALRAVAARGGFYAEPHAGTDGAPPPHPVAHG